MSFRRNGDSTYTLTIPAEGRQLLEALVPQMRDLVAQGDSLTWRLFPNAYPDHDRAAKEYREMVGDDLAQRHLSSLDTVAETLNATRVEEDQMQAWMFAINDLRLVIGTRLEVDDETELEDFIGDTERSLYSTYEYLGYMLEHIVQAIDAG